VAQALVIWHAGPFWLANTLAGTTDWFAAGMALAVISVAAFQGPGLARRASRIVEDWSWAVWIAGAGAFLVATRIFDTRIAANGRPGVYTVSTVAWLGNHLSFALAAGLLLAPAVLGARGPVRRILSWRPFALLGLISYGIYLWHLPLAGWLATTGAYPNLHGGGLDIAARVHFQPTFVLFAAIVIVSVVAATVSYHLIELPFLRLKTRSSGGGPLAPPGPLAPQEQAEAATISA
jgi:peptidoglycan/LPS O-acetylase OafA/YrhL